MEERVRLSLLARKILTWEESRRAELSKTRGINFKDLIYIEGISTPPVIYHLIVILTAALVWLSLNIIGNVPATVAAGCCVWYFWMIFPNEGQSRKRKAILTELIPFCEMIARGLSSGHHVEWSFLQAAKSLSPSGALREHMIDAIKAVKQGAGLERALDELTVIDITEELLLTIRVLRLVAKRGARSAEALTEFADTLRRRFSIFERTRRETATITHLFWIVFVFLALASLFLLLVHPVYFSRAFDDPLGESLVEYGLSAILICLTLFRKSTVII